MCGDGGWAMWWMGKDFLENVTLEHWSCIRLVHERLVLMQDTTRSRFWCLAPPAEVVDGDIQPTEPGQPTWWEFFSQWLHSAIENAEVMELHILSFFILGKQSNSDPEKCGNLASQSRGSMSQKKRKKNLLPYFRSDPQGDLCKTSTFPKEVGHLVTLIFIEKPDLIVAS